MRTLSLLAMAALLAAGAAACNDTTGNADMTAPDLVAFPDLSVVPSPNLVTSPNLSGPTTCNTAFQCVLPCATVPCVVACGASLTGDSKKKWDALGACTGAMCFAHDGGPGACATVTDRSQACLDCAATKCAAEEQACQADQ